MPSVRTRWVERHVIALYVMLAYGFSWAIFVPLALQARGVIDPVVPRWLHYCGSFGPALSALALTSMIGGASGLRELLGRMFRWRVALLWWMAAFAPIFIFIALALATTAFGESRLHIAMLGKADFLPDAGVWMLAIWFLTYGLGEETGWRGFLLPRLQHGTSALKASLLVAAVWGLWHAPAFFYVYDPRILLGFVVGLVAGSIMFTWLYNGSGGSILMVALLHATFNLTSGCTECKSGVVAAVLSTLVVLWAIVVIVWFKPANLSRRSRHTISPTS